MKIICDDEADCEDLVWLEGNADLPDHVAGNHEIRKVVVVRKEVKAD